MLKYKLAEKVIDQDDRNALSEWIKENHQLTKGELTIRFEEKWAKWVGTRYAVFCNSGSSANLLTAYTVLISNRLRNKKVIVPSVGWVTTVAPFIQFGFEPIMCGADEDNFGLDLNHLEDLLIKNDAATVIMVQVLGVPSVMHDLMWLRAKYDFLLLEDACAALGAEFGGKKVGSFGDMSSFSFFYGHQLSTIEGGMVNTNDDGFYDFLLMLRSHGWGKDLSQKQKQFLAKKYHIDDFHEPFTFFVPGFNLRSTDVNAFLGLRQMEKADRIVNIRKKNHLTYVDNLQNVDYQKWHREAIPCSISFGAIAKSPDHRRTVVEELDKNGIETRLFSAGNLGLHPFWFERYGKFHHPVSDRVHQCGFFLPNNESLKLEHILSICDVVNSVEV